MVLVKETGNVALVLASVGLAILLDGAEWV